jgi:CspA family cold shock protein
VIALTVVMLDVRGDRLSQMTFAERDHAEAAMTGTIKKITDRGFGFITTTEGQEYFFHQTSVQGGRFDDLREGESVEFDVGQGPKGPRAENVRVNR